MNTTSSQLPICIHCGTPRPADETLCPTCGKPWIDTTIQPKPASVAVPPSVVPTADTEDGGEEEKNGSSAAAVASTAAVTGSKASGTTDKEPDGEPTEPNATDTKDTDKDTDTAGDAAPDETQAVVAASAVAGAKASGTTDKEPDGEPTEPNATDTKDTDANASPLPPPGVGADDTGEFAFDAWTQPVEDEKTRRATAWLVPAGIAVAILAAVAYLVFGGNSTPSTTTIVAINTTVAPSSTTSTSTSVTTTTLAPTTTAIAFPLPIDWPPKGEPIAVDDLTLKQSAIGPIDIGMPIGDVAGVLTASLGAATASGIDGVCPPDESYWLQFGQLTAIFDGFDSASVFVSYRYDEPQGTDPELGLKTLSGIGIGDTVEELIDTYTQFTISFEVIDSKDFFRLSDGGDLLLWGPVSSVDPAGLIEGIYSPTPCDTAP